MLKQDVVAELQRTLHPYLRLGLRTLCACRMRAHRVLPPKAQRSATRRKGGALLTKAPPATARNAVWSGELPACGTPSVQSLAEGSRVCRRSPGLCRTWPAGSPAAASEAPAGVRVPPHPKKRSKSAAPGGEAPILILPRSQGGAALGWEAPGGELVGCLGVEGEGAANSDGHDLQEYADMDMGLTALLAAMDRMSTARMRAFVARSTAERPLPDVG